MSSAPFMQLYIADYLGDTPHLTTEQHGAYLLVLMAMWRAGGFLPNDPTKLARIARLSPRRWKAIATDLMPFFAVEGDQITQKRLRSERQKVEEISEKRRAAGMAGAEAKSLKTNKTASANGQAGLKHSQISDTREDIREEKKDKGAEGDGNSTPRVRLVALAGSPAEYAFEAGTIRLTQRDYDAWVKAFPNLSLDAELWQLDEWASQQPKWFPAVSGALAKRNREAQSAGKVKTRWGMMSPEDAKIYRAVL